MKKNMGSLDKAIRLLVAALIVVLAVTKVITGTLAIVLIVVGAIFVLTSIVSVCPAYMPFGIRTLKKKQ
jgi:hypothetical protein